MDDFMKRILLFISLTFFYVSNSFALSAKLDELQVDSSFRFQNTPVWCWAATIQMALNYYGFNITQNEIVTRTFGASVPSTGNWIQMTNNLNYLGNTANGERVLVSATVYAGSPSSEAIINHLKQNKPIIMAFHNNATFTGHAILITGVDYHYAGNRAVIDRVTIRDPFPYNPQHIANGGKVVIPNTIRPTNMWLVDATRE